MRSKSLLFVALVLLGSPLRSISVEAQRAGPAAGVPVAADYKGLTTDRSYKPLLATAAGSAVPPAVHVTPIDDELRRSYRLDPFYTKTLTSAGVVIVGSDKVSDWALLEAAYTMDHMLHGSPQWVRDALKVNKVRLAVMAVVEYTMDLPENRRRPGVPGARTSPDQAAYQDRRSRGLGGLPDCSCAEENLLNLRGDPYGGGRQGSGENITIHEFSHTVASAIQRAQGRNGTFWTRLRKAFADAKAPDGRLAVFNRNRREPVYASTDEQEYWAEGAQAWFDCAQPNNSGGLAVRADVKQKDAELAALLAEIYGDGPWRYVKTTARKADGTPLRPQEELDHLAGLDALRSRFPVYNVNNSPRVIALGQQDAARPGGP
jgi:alpha-glucosidase